METTQATEMTPQIVVEPKFSIEVGHDRYQNLIIKKLRISGDNVDELFELLQQALGEFNLTKGMNTPE